MNVSDYIIQFFIDKGIKDFFGYQGTMIAYFVDAIHRNPFANNHSCYNEQGAAFAACGYAQASGKCGVAYSTSGPGAVNMISGVANAYFDSEPVIFITGQLNTYEYTGISEMRQQGFQQIDIVSICNPITKYCVQISDASKIKYEIEKAWHIANEGRKGPVLLDIPMNIQRTVISPSELLSYSQYGSPVYDNVDYDNIYHLLASSKRPLLLVGNGVSLSDREKLSEFISTNKIPYATSLLCKDYIDQGELYCGFIGGSYGSRLANLLATEKADFILAIGIALSKKQTGVKVSEFARNAIIVRVEIDKSQLKYQIKSNEIDICTDSHLFISGLSQNRITCDLSEWHSFIREASICFDEHDRNIDDMYPNRYIEVLSDIVNSNYNVVSDVGQHMMWMAKSFKPKNGQRILFSGAHGAMGYSLPAAIGAHYYNGKPSLCVAGDGAFQMNIQELQWVVREKLPIKMIIFNNNCLGMIRSVQEDYIESRYEGVSETNNYSACHFSKIAKAYGIPSVLVNSLDEFQKINLDYEGPELFEILLPENTFALPKVFFGDKIYNQRPYIDPNILEELLKK